MNSVATKSEVKVIEENMPYDISTKSEVRVLEEYIPYDISTVSETIDDENKHKRLYGSLSSNLKIVKQKKMKERLFGASPKSNLPEKYDARDYENFYGLPIVPPVRDQDPYGTCWAFSIIGMMETSIRKKNLVKTEEEADLSEAALAYFSLEGLENVTNNDKYIDKPGVEGNDYVKTEEFFANAGGYPLDATLMATTYMGPVKESDFPYSIIDDIKNNKIDSDIGKFAFNNNAFEIGDVEYIESNDIESIKEAIMKNGSVGMSYFAGASDRQDDDGEYYYLGPSGFGINHGVIIVGWDDTVPKGKFGSYSYELKGNGAWLVRNSWGEDYGNGGYFYMSYYDESYYPYFFL